MRYPREIIKILPTNDLSVSDKATHPRPYTPPGAYVGFFQGGVFLQGGYPCCLRQHNA